MLRDGVRDDCMRERAVSLFDCDDLARNHDRACLAHIGQFAKFIRPGAKRVLSATTSGNLMTTAFVNTDGSTVTVVMNRTDDPVRFELKNGTQDVAMDAPSHSIQTIVVTPSLCSLGSS